jgi:putative aldouronate transport system substrate-binding protein
LVDKEFPNLDLWPAWQKVEKHLIGAIAGIYVDYCDREGLENRPPTSFVTDDEVKAGAAVVVIPPLVGPQGKQGANLFSAFAIGSNGWAINRKVDDAKAARILQMMDWLKVGEKEQWVMAEFGKEGVHFKWQGEAWKSAALPIDQKDVPAGYPKIGAFGSQYPLYWTFDRLIFLYPEKNYNFKNYLLRGNGRKYEIVPYRYDLFNETKIPDILKKNGAAMNTMRDEFFFKAITGALDVDKEWDGHVASWLKAGGQDYLNELAKAPLYAELRKGVVKY